MKTLFFFSAFILLISCNDTKEELLDLNDIAPTSDNYKEGRKLKESDHQTEIEIETLLDEIKLIEQQIDLEALRATDTLLFPDRFSAQSSQRFYYSLEKDSILYAKWKFKDSIKTKNVFLNWTNCFGVKCKSIRIGEKIKLQKDGFILLANDTCLIYIQSNSTAEQKKWINYFTADKKSKWDFLLTQSKNGVVAWKSYFEGEFIEIAPNIQVDTSSN